MAGRVKGGEAADIEIRGAREHNLRNVNLTLPRNRLIVMTGVSGSGKSSLAFDTLYAEGQRRYVESLSSYARQFLGQLPKPDVDRVSGLAPSISIQQKSASRNPRSTVGTITEIQDYLRVLFARVGRPGCAKCGREIRAQTTEQIIESIGRLDPGTRFSILAPLVQRQKGEYRDLFDDLLKQGFVRARVNGNLVALADDLGLDRQMRHTIELVVDRLISSRGGRNRLAEAVETALRMGHGTLLVATSDDAAPVPGADGDAADRRPGTTDTLYSALYACAPCGISYEPPTPQLFSFNSPLGMCLDCNGLGRRHEFLPEAVVNEPDKSLWKGAIGLVGAIGRIGRWRKHIFQGAAAAIEADLGLAPDSLLQTPWRELPADARHLVLYGTGDRHITYAWRYRGGVWKHGGTFDGVIPKLLESYHKTNNPMRRRQLEKAMQFADCSACRGTRLNGQAQAVTITTANTEFGKQRSRRRKSLPEVCALSIGDAAAFFEDVELDDTGHLIASEVLKEIRARLGFLLRCGLDYLALDRSAPTLSGGETQRIRLAGQIGSGLVGVVYVLDEPSIGLHPRDNNLLLESLCDLRDQGNTVIVVEHDEETMRAADHIVDFGPGPGIRGGRVVAEGTLAEIKKNPRSVTGRYLVGQDTIPVPDARRQLDDRRLEIKAARHNNLRGINVTIPLGGFVCITGVSGSGKSSLASDILWQVLNRDLNKGKGDPGTHSDILGLEYLDRAINIDQAPIGRTPRSNPATYVKLLDAVRDLYSKLPEARARGYKPGRFSFNVDKGRCEACEGYGANRLEMDFLADIWVTCPVCEGRRFHHETLEVRFRGKNIAEVLEMDVQEALEHFENHPRVSRLLTTLRDVGLEYLKLGQPSPTLSGGEAQRIKLARELGKRSTGSTMYLLDEPTTGLHFADISKLLDVLHGFVDNGNSVLVVEHNLDVIKTADWVIDLGPEGGAGGGRVVVAGTPETVAQCDASHTGEALADLLPGVRRRQRRPGTSSGATHRQPATRKRKKAEVNRIAVRGARQHNLKDVSLLLPRNQFHVFCGPSGSGKSSLAMDTLYAEGQRRYVESLSAYARQFLGQMPKPRVEQVTGLSPAIAIEQKNTGTTPRSTVGTVTEIYDYLRVLFTRLGTRHCPDCQRPISRQTTDEVIGRVRSLPEGRRVLVLAPQQVRVGQEYDSLWRSLREDGFLRVRIDGTTCRIEDVPDIDRQRRHTVEVVVDRITPGRTSRTRIADGVELALSLGRGEMRIATEDPDRDEAEWAVEPFSLHAACESCGRSFEELSPNHFSFNSSLGWCSACEGLGTQQGTNLAALVADESRTLEEGAVSAWPEPSSVPQFRAILKALSKTFGLETQVPFSQLSDTDRHLVLYGTGDRWFNVRLPEKTTVAMQYKGLYPAIEEASRVSRSYRGRLLDLVGEVDCSTCGGHRLRPDVAAVRLGDHTLGGFCRLPLGQALEILKTVKLDRDQKRIAGDLLREATSRLKFLVDVGLDYLTLDRPFPTLSGGESQRIRLAGQVGRALTGVLYVLDEPTIGLHPRDNTRLLGALKRLRDLGNTLVVVEHDREVLETADRLVDFGPAAGRHGGQVVAQGSPSEVAGRKKSLTGQFLSDTRSIPIPEHRRLGGPDDEPPAGGWLELTGARKNNLNHVDLKIPLGTLTCITGVSGSGKSSLIEDTLARAVTRQLHRSGDAPGPFDSLRGVELLNKVIVVDQQPLGSTPKSNPGTYTGVFDEIRELYSRLPEAKVRGFRPGRFSFNRAGGRCEACEGNGQKCIEMHFLPDVWVECDECRGRRYNTETLSVTYQGHTIADVLDMPIGDALKLFENIPRIRAPLATLCAIGLDYLTLGQPAPTLSGGEAQRVKLASELARPQTGQTLYLLDEPTTGLHFDDIDKLLQVLESLVAAGNTVVVIEHNLDVIKTADWIVDLGPEAGAGGGRIVACGTPESVVEQARASKSARRKSSPGNRERSWTGELLASVLRSGQRATRELFHVRDVATKREGDLDFRQIGRNTQMPWEQDGRRWHTVDRIAHNGQPARWEGQALEKVIDRLAEHPDLQAPDYNHRSVIEISGPVKKDGWFFHALTGNEWLVTLKFRVRRNTFNQHELAEELQLKPLDDIDELPVYGRDSRVRLKNIKGPWQDVTLKVHWLREIDTPAFDRFLDRACDAFFEQANHSRKNPEDLMPWKVLGKRWHTMRKGFPRGARIGWPEGLVELLADQVEAATEESVIDWTGRISASVRPAARAPVWAQLWTKRTDVVELFLLGPPGAVTLGRIAGLGARREITPYKDGRDVVKIGFDSLQQARDTDLGQFLKEHRDACAMAE